MSLVRAQEEPQVEDFFLCAWARRGAIKAPLQMVVVKCQSRVWTKGRAVVVLKWRDHCV